MITIFKTQHCAYCKMVATYLTSKGVEFNTVDITDNPTKRQELADTTGYMTVPITTDGKIYVVGWNVAKLNELIKNVS